MWSLCMYDIHIKGDATVKCMHRVKGMIGDRARQMGHRVKGKGINYQEGNGKTLVTVSK
jgi:hypothetical protein